MVDGQAIPLAAPQLPELDDVTWAQLGHDPAVLLPVERKEYPVGSLGDPANGFVGGSHARFPFPEYTMVSHQRVKPEETSSVSTQNFSGP